MSGSLNDVFPDPISMEDEKIPLDLLKQRMTVLAEIAVDLFRAMERRFGPEARYVVLEMARNQQFPPREEVGEPEADLQDSCALISRTAVGTHTWKMSQTRKIASPIISRDACMLKHSENSESHSWDYTMCKG